MLNHFLLATLIIIIKNIFSVNSAIDIDMDLLNKEKPVNMVIVLVRHGLRTVGEATYLNDPLKDRKSEIWPLGLLQLTNKGKMEQYKLGMWLQKRYSSLLGGGYSGETVYALSTSSDRAVMSGMCLMAGLFPPKEDQLWNEDLLWQPIPVHSYDETAGNLLNSHDHVSCPKFWTEYEKMKKSKEYIDLFEKHKEVREFIYNNTGTEMKDYRDLNYLYDYIEKQQEENITIPAWAQQIFPDPWNSASVPLLIMPTFNEPLKRLFMGPFLKEITGQFQMKSTGKSERRLYLFSGHDYNISNLLNLFGIFNWLVPPYSSALLIELRKDRSDNYFVSIFFKNSTENAYLMKIEGCDSICSLENFNFIISPYIPQDWHQECNSSTIVGLQKKGFGVIFILMVWKYLFI